MAYKLTRETLVLDLYGAFILAKQHKTGKEYVKIYERRLKKNIERLADDLFFRRYKAEPSSCFIVERPKKREVFAAQFRDRIVHHLYFNYTHKIFERTFIQDSYSCIPERGTHYGINRLEKHIRQESKNYQQECFILKLDKRGYFMHINRYKLLEIATNTLEKMRTRKVDKNDSKVWDDVIDFEFVKWLTKEIVLLNPKDSCNIVGDFSAWDDLDKSKSLFYTDEGCGLPIGNLTSQLFSNVYLNEFDQFMKRELKCKHYGRYVDDSYVVSRDKNWLLSLIPKIRKFLKSELGLDLHMGKLQIASSKIGVEFLGTFVRPYRKYVSNKTLRRTRYNLQRLNMEDREVVFRSINSFLGTLVHNKSFNIRRDLFFKEKYLGYGVFDEKITKLERVNA